MGGIGGDGRGGGGMRRVSKGEGGREWEEKESVMRNWMRRNEEEEGIKTERKR